MDYESMDERGYRLLNSDQYSERRSLVLDLAEALPEDVTEEQMRSIDAELGIIKAEDARRDALIEARNHKAAEVIGGAGTVIDAIGEQEQKEERKMQTLGEFAVEHLDLSAMRNGMSRSAGTDFLYRAYNDPHTSTAIEVLDQRVIDTVKRRLEIRQLFGAESISGTSLKYFVLGATEAGDGAPATVNENGAKPQFHVPYSSKTASLQKIAGWFYETDELIEDNAFLKSAIDERGLFELDKAVETYLMSQLLGTTGIGTVSEAVSPDAVFEAIMKVKTDSDYDADAIVINPSDYQTLRLAKDGGNSGQYYGGGCFYGPYGNGQLSLQPGLWGLNTVISNAVSEGTVLVGAFGQGASVITKADEGARLEVVTGDHDDRTHNRVTVIVEERVALAVRVPVAFVTVTEES